MSTKSKISRPEAIAQQMERLPGWSVERHKEGGYRTLRAVHSDGRVTRLSFLRTSASPVRDVFAGGEFWHGDKHGEIANVSAAIREMARPPDVPFALDDDADVVLAAVDGKTVEWENTITGKLESGTVPRGSAKTALQRSNLEGNQPEHRILTFADAAGGFRSARLCTIRKVS